MRSIPCRASRPPRQRVLPDHPHNPDDAVAAGGVEHAVQAAVVDFLELVFVELGGLHHAVGHQQFDELMDEIGLFFIQRTNAQEF